MAGIYVGMAPYRPDRAALLEKVHPEAAYVHDGMGGVELVFCLESSHGGPGSRSGRPSRGSARLDP